MKDFVKNKLGWILAFLLALYTYVSDYVIQNPIATDVPSVESVEGAID